MSRYDQPGFAGAFPTGEMLDAGSLSNTQGSSGAVPHGATDGTVVGTHAEYSGWTSSQLPPDGGTASVGALNTEASSNQGLDVISGTHTGPVDTSGKVCGPSHPNAGR